jgi:hypothetical protein
MQHVFLRILLLFPVAASLLGCGSDEPKEPAWVGKTYLLDTPAISDARWKKPVGLGPSIINYAPQFLFAVAAGTGDALAVTVATAQEGVQDPCTPTVQATIARSEFPNSVVSVPAFSIHIVSSDPTHPGQWQTTLHDVAFQDVLPGLPSAATAQFSAILDFAELYRIMAPEGSKEATCAAMETGGVPCEICPWNGERFCQSVEAIEVTTQETAISITPITAGEVPATCP